MNEQRGYTKNTKIKTPPNPDKDGIDHINVYVHGKTELGRLLTHFQHMPFRHPRFGNFQNMEGYWHWVKSEERPDELRYLTGQRAKALGSDASQITRRFLPDFQELILEGNYCKITQNPHLQELLLASDLPFEHYYMDTDQTTPNGRTYPVRIRSSGWLSEVFAKIRTMIRAGKVPPGLITVEPPTDPSHPQGD